MSCLVLDQLGKDMLVEGSGEVAFKQLVDIDSLGNNPSHKLEVTKMVGVNVREVIDGVSDPISRTTLEEGIVGFEDLPGNDDVQLPQQSFIILALVAYRKAKHYTKSTKWQNFTFKDNINPIFPLLCTPPV